MNWRRQLDWVRETRNEDIVAMRAAGASLRAIGKEFSLSGVMILKILRARGAAPPAKNDRPSPSEQLRQRLSEVHPGRRGQ